MPQSTPSGKERVMIRIEERQQKFRLSGTGQPQVCRRLRHIADARTSRTIKRPAQTNPAVQYESANGRDVRHIS